MNRFFLLALIPLAGTPAPSPKSSSDAASVFARVAAVYGDGAAHVANFTQTYTPAGFATARRENGTLWIQAPQRLRFDYAGKEKKVFTYDAGEGRLFTPEDRQLTIRKLSPEDRSRLPIVFLSDPAELERQYSLSLEPGEGGGTRVLLTPRAPRPDLAWLPLDRRRRDDPGSFLRGLLRQPLRVPLRGVAQGETAPRRRLPGLGPAGNADPGELTGRRPRHPEGSSPKDPVTFSSQLSAGRPLFSPSLTADS